MRRLLTTLAALACCSCGGGGSGGPADLDRIVVVNTTDAITIQAAQIEAYEDGNILNTYGAFEAETDVPPGLARPLDQAQVDALFQAVPGPAVIDVFVEYGNAEGDFTGGDVRWSPGDGTLYVSVFANPNFPGPGEDDEYLTEELSRAEYDALLAGGEISEAGF